MSKRLLLWDIDGTLIRSGGAGQKALVRVVQKRFGGSDDLRDIEIAGRTDVGIARNILRKYKVESTAENVRELLDAYLDDLEHSLPQTSGCVLPGIPEILARLHANPACVLALLTGNLRRGAELKLRHYGLWHYFEFGAFADDHYDRNELGAFARRRAAKKYGEEFEVARIDVIGDTAHDIACGKIFGARTVAVATGSWTREKLAESSPDFIFDDFSQVDQVFAALDW